MNQLLIILISQVPEYPWMEIIFNSTGDPIDFEDDIDKITTNGGNEVYLILNTDDLILNAYPKEETDEEPFKVGASQGKAYIESQEISFNRGGTIINKEL